MNKYFSKQREALAYEELLHRFTNRYDALKKFLENDIDNLNPESTKEIIFEIHTNMIFLGKYIRELRMHLLGEKKIKHSYIETMQAYIKAYGL